MLKRRFTLFSAVFLTCVLFSTACFAQSAGTAPSQSLPLVPILMGLVGLLTSAYNSGSILGFETLPKAWLPVLSMAVAFLTGAESSLQHAAAATSWPALLTAIGAGLIALGANGAGAGLHWQATAHKRAALTTKKDDDTPPPSDNPEPTQKLNVVEREAAKLPPAAQRVVVHGGWVVGLCLVLGLLMLGCIPAQNPQQQAAQIQAAEQCIQTNWGQPIEQIATTCLQNFIPATEDVIADVEAIIELVEGQTSGANGVALAQASFPYKDNPTVTGLVIAKKSAFTANVKSAFGAPGKN